MPHATSNLEDYGPGTFTDQEFRAVPDDARRVFELLARSAPGFTQDPLAWSSVSFDGDAEPIAPGPLKTPVISAALHAMCGIVGNELLDLRSGATTHRPVSINVDHAAFWLGAVAITHRNGIAVPEYGAAGTLAKLFEKDLEKETFGTPLRLRTTALYPTEDPMVWYQLHGSLNAAPVLEKLGLRPDTACESRDKAYEIISKRMREIGADELEMVHVKHGLCGSVCHTPAGWRKTEMHKELSKHPLINYERQSHAVPTPPIPIPHVFGDKRPLAGIKVVELVRIIAGPVIGSTLAAFGADVIRVNCSKLPDFNSLQLTLNAGIRTVDLDLGIEDDVRKLQELVEEADIFVQGFRPGTIAKRGLSLQNMLEMAGKRGRGIVYVEENCYGPDGPYADRPGWQQIADSATGCAHVTGRSLGHTDGTCVLPALPVPDMLTSLIGAIGAMMAIRDRARQGDSYHVHAALMAAAALPLQPEIGLYSPEVVQKCNDRFEWGVTDPSMFLVELLDVVLTGWKRVFPDRFALGSPWMHILEGPWGKFELLRPVVQLADADVSPRWISAPEPNCLHDGEISWL